MAVSWVILPRNHHIVGLVQERRNSSALAMELRLSCTNPSIDLMLIYHWWHTVILAIEYKQWKLSRKFSRHFILINLKRDLCWGRGKLMPSKISCNWFVLFVLFSKTSGKHDFKSKFNESLVTFCAHIKHHKTEISFHTNHQRYKLCYTNNLLV